MKIKITIKLETPKTVIKGGSWNFRFPQQGRFIGSAIEGKKQKEYRYSGIGFRIILRKEV